MELLCGIIYADPGLSWLCPRGSAYDNMCP